jgi:hypothetical protein
VGEEGRPCTKRKPNYAERGTEFGITPVQGKRGFFQLNDDHHWKEDFREKPYRKKEDFFELQCHLGYFEVQPSVSTANVTVQKNCKRGNGCKGLMSY